MELVVEKVLEVCPTMELQETKRGLKDFDELYEWCAYRSGYLEGRHPNDTKAFFQYKGWCAIVDFSMCMSTEDQVLASLSEAFGSVVTVTTQGSAGYACYSLHEDGHLRRRITTIDGMVEEEGSRIAAESRIDVSRFHIHEADILWQAHGLPSFLLEPPGKFTAVHYIDRNAGAPPAADPSSGDGAGAENKPWWAKFS